MHSTSLMSGTGRTIPARPPAAGPDFESSPTPSTPCPSSEGTTGTQLIRFPMSTRRSREDRGGETFQPSRFATLLVDQSAAACPLMCWSPLS